MSNNNDSRVLFSDFVNKNRGVVKRLDKRNVFEYEGSVYAFSLSNNGYAECRQFYSDCDRLLTLDYKTMKMYDIPKEHLEVDTKPNRITPAGHKAFTAVCEFDKSFVSNLKV